MDKPFLLFSGDHYYPSGGFHDFKGSFKTIEEALEAKAKTAGDWYHIVDIRIMREVANDAW